MADTQVTFDIVARDRASDDFKRVGTAADKAGDRFKRFGGITKRVARTAGIALGGALVTVAYGLGNAAKAAADEEQEMAVLRNTLRKATKATDKQADSAEKWITQLQNATGVSDGDLRPALGKLAIATGDITEAQDLLNVALDISVARGKPLTTIVEALGKAAQGSTTGLQRLGIKTKDAAGEALSFDEILKNAAKTMGGAASKAADTTAGRYARLKVQFEDVKEEIGNALLPILNDLGEWFLNKGLPRLQKFGGWIRDHLFPVFGKIERRIRDNVLPALSDLAAWFQDKVLPKIRRVRDFLVDRLFPAFTRMVQDVAPTVQGALEDIGEDIDDVADAFDRLTGKTDGANDSMNLLGLAIKGFSKLVSGIVDDIAQTIQVILYPFEKLAQAAQWFLDTLRQIPAAIKGLRFSGLGDIFRVPDIPGLATGGTVSRSGMAIVGERGPELVSLPAGSTVYSNAESRKAQAGGVGFHVEQTIVTADPQDAADQAVRGIRRVAWSAGWGVA